MENTLQSIKTSSVELCPTSGSAPGQQYWPVNGSIQHLSPKQDYYEIRHE